MQTTQSCSARDYLQSRGLQSAYISLTYLSFDTCSLPRECGPDGWRKHVTGRGTSRNLYQLGPSRAAAGNLLSAELSPGRAYAGMVLNKFCGVVMRACFTCCVADICASRSLRESSSEGAKVVRPAWKILPTTSTDSIDFDSIVAVSTFSLIWGLKIISHYMIVNKVKHGW